MSYQLIRTIIVAAILLIPTSENLFAQNFSSPRNDTIAGGVAGAIIGGIVGNQNDETPEGIAIGAVVGAIAGNVAGNVRNENIARDQAYRSAVQQHRQQQLFAQQQIEQQNFNRAASINDIISMTQNGIGPDVIATHLQNVGVQQEIGVNEIITLHRNGVNESVISLMQQIGSGGVAHTAIVQPTVIERAPVVVAPAYVAPTYVGPTIVTRGAPVYRYSSRPGYSKGNGHRHGPPPSRYGSRPRPSSQSGIHFRF